MTRAIVQFGILTMRRTLGVAGLLLFVGGSAAVAWGGDPSTQVEFAIAENAAPGAAIGRVPALADDAGSESDATFAFVADGLPVPCRIHPQTGELTLADAPLDFEARSRLEFTVRIRRPRSLDAPRRAYLADLLQSGVDPAALDDLLFQTSERSIALNVLDAPEPPVLAPAPLTFVIQADRPPTAQIAVRDPDAHDAFTYELLDDDGRFQIDPQTGLLTCLIASPAEAGSFPLTVRVTDSSGLSDAATFNVDVIVPTPPAVAASGPGAPDAGSSAAASPGVLPTPLDDDVPPDMDDLPSTSLAAETAPTLDEPIAAAFPAVTTPATKQPVIPETSALPLVAAVTPAAPAATAAATPSAMPPSPARLKLWLTLMLLAGGAVGAVIIWRLHRRAPVAEPAPNSMFRVVREARMLNAAGGSLPRAPLVDECVPSLPLADLDTADADKEAVHRLIATALKQSTGGSASPIQEAAPPQVPATPAIPDAPMFAPATTPSVPPPLPSYALVEAARSDTPAQAETSATYDISSLSREPLSPHCASLAEAMVGDACDLARVSERADVPQDVLDPQPIAGDTFDYASIAERTAAPPDTCDVQTGADEPAATISGWRDSVYAASESDSLSSTLQSALPPLPSDTYDFASHADNAVPSAPADPDIAALDQYAAYEPIDDDLGGSFSGLRLSQQVEPVADSYDAPHELTEPLESEPIETMNLVEPAGATRTPQSSDEDERLTALRRQLSEMFGVPADRPRPPAEPDRTVDFAQEPLVETSTETFAPAAPEPEPEPPAAAIPEVAAEQPNDPVSSWLAYVKQRSLEQAAPARPAPTPAPRPVVPPPPPAAAPAVRAPAPVAAAPRSTVATSLSSVMRVDKTAVREEISLLRDVANQHSRKILERRALHQRARFAWVLWGTALVVLCVAGLSAVQHASNVIRTAGWALFGGAAIALAGCVRGFQNLSGRSDNVLDDDDDAIVEDLERTVAPDLMTAEMEQTLRAVMEEESRSTVGSAGPPS